MRKSELCEEGTAFSKTQRKKWFGYLKSIKQTNISEVKWEREGEEEAGNFGGEEKHQGTQYLVGQDVKFKFYSKSRGMLRIF